MTTPDTKTTPPAVEPQTPPADPADGSGAGSADTPVEATPEDLLEMVRKKDAENVKLKKERKADAKELARLKAIEADQMSEQEKAIETAKAEARSEVELEFKVQLLGERIMRAATGRLADPSDVVLIDFSDIDDPDDIKAIDAAIDELLKAKPHLAAENAPPPADPGREDQGPQGRAVTPNPTQGQLAEKWLRGQLTR